MSTEKAVTTASLKRALRLGAANGRGVATLAFELGTTERAIRKLVDELIEEGVPVCAHPSTGYYIAQTEDEIQGTCDYLRGRAMHSLHKIGLLRSAFAGGPVGDAIDDAIPDIH